MKGVASIGAVCALLAAVNAASSLPAVTIQGNAFMAGGSRFFVRGVDYQPGGSSANIDPIANSQTCMRDIKYFQQLGINTIRVYTVDNTANHDTCMNALAAAGIYLALDVNNGLYSINRANPAPSYNAQYLQSVFATIDAFAGYSNTLLFFSGNEVINNESNTNTAPYIKAVGRDMKNYIAARGYRHIPVGYSAADVSSNRYQTAQYMNCGPDAMARGDFFAFNDYSWCDPSSFTMSGWDAKVQQYSNYSIPIFLSEFGCITNPPRDFGEIQALYNQEMTSVYSGGLVYEFTEESNNPGYGLVTVNSPTSVSPIQPGFSNLMNMYSANPAPSNAAYSSNLPYFTDCPVSSSGSSSQWNISPFVGFGLPALPQAAASYMTNGAGKGPGLTGAGSQNAGSSSVTAVTQTASGIGYSSGTSAPTTAGSGSGSSTSKAAAASVRPLDFSMGPVVSVGVMVICAMLGAALL